MADAGCVSSIGTGVGFFDSAVLSGGNAINTPPSRVNNAMRAAWAAGVFIRMHSSTGWGESQFNIVNFQKMMGPNFTPRWPLQGLLLMAVSMLIAGCGLTASHPRALLPLENFVPLASDPRVRVEPGFKAYGERVAQALPQIHAGPAAGAGPDDNGVKICSWCFHDGYSLLIMIALHI